MNAPKMKTNCKYNVLLIEFMALCCCATGCTSKVISYYDSTKRVIYQADDLVFAIGKTNNGVEKYGQDVDFLISAIPDERQMSYHEIGGYYNFIHFGINTFTNREWGTGHEDISKFNPTKLDTDAWCEALKQSGSCGVILTAKHHDGFCLFPSEYTDHDISYTPYKNGNGDIVKELSLSCQKYDMKMGIYLSPWDMHEKTYGKDAYNTYFKNQLREVLNKEKYGDIFEVWFDGARGEDTQLDADFSYDFNRNFTLVMNAKPVKFSIRNLYYNDNIFGRYVTNSGETINLNSDGTCSFIGGSFGNTELTSTYTYFENEKDLLFDNAPNDVSLLAEFNDSYFEIIRELQPKAVISVIGPDVRWVGNEEGIMNDPEWSIRGKTALTQEEIEDHSQHGSDETLTPSSEVVSRSVLLQYKELMWNPCESDVRNRPSWFYHKKESPKSASSLVSLYYRNVGCNGNLLLNVPPNKDGLFDSKDIKVLKEFGERISNDFSKPINYTPKIGDNTSLTYSEELKNKLNDPKLGTGYHFNNTDYIVDLDFDEQKDIKNIVISEDITCSQRVEDYSIYLKKSNGAYVLVSHKETIGAKRIVALDPKLDNTATGIRFVVNQSRHNPVINYIGVFE